MKWGRGGVGITFGAKKFMFEERGIEKDREGRGLSKGGKDRK